MLHYGQKIETEGQIIDGIRTNVNYSDIVTELIQAAGTLCEYYASDIVYDIKDIENYVENLREEVMFIGIRDSGCDGYNFVKSRLENSATYGNNNYIRLYRLETSIPDDTTYKIELRRIDEYDARQEIFKEAEI